MPAQALDFSEGLCRFDVQVSRKPGATSRLDCPGDLGSGFNFVLGESNPSIARLVQLSSNLLVRGTSLDGIPTTGTENVKLR